MTNILILISTFKTRKSGRDCYLKCSPIVAHFETFAGNATRMQTVCAIVHMTSLSEYLDEFLEFLFNIKVP